MAEEPGRASSSGGEDVGLLGDGRTEPTPRGSGSEASFHRRRLALGVAVAAVYAVIRVVVVLRQGPRALVSTYEDDAYYYFGIARSAAEGLGSTFNTLTPTNGYHPLWQLVLVALASFSPADIPATAYVAQGVLLVVTAAVALATVRWIGESTAGLVAILLVATVPFEFGHWLFLGMENSLLLPLLLAFLWLALRPDGGTRSTAWAGVVAAVMVLTRLDAAVVVAGACVVVLVGPAALTGGRRRLTSGVLLTAPSVLALLVYAVVNTAHFDTALPVSGKAKAIGGGGDWVGQIVAFLSFRSVLGVGMGVLVVVAIPSALWLLRDPTLFSGRARVFLSRTLLTLAMAQVAQLAYFAATTTWRWWPWYYYLVGPSLFFAAVVVITAVVRRVPRGSRSLPVMAAVIGLVFVTVGVREQAALSTRAGVHEDGPVVAARVSEVVPPDAVLAMGDRAGVVGWSLPNPLIQVEGLTESVEYLDVLRAGGVDDDLRRRGVAVYLRWDRVSIPTSGCWTLGEPTAGAGPVSRIPVCADQLLFSHRSADGSTWTAWRR